MLKDDDCTFVADYWSLTPIASSYAGIGSPDCSDEFYATEEAKAFSERLELHAAELSFYHPRCHWLRSIFVPCDFYPEAEAMIFDYFDPARKLPDYKTLPRP